jgi:glycosyltransferase involved in cell wall biosynthesis
LRQAPRPVGITRSIRLLLDHWRRLAPVPVRACAFDAAVRAYREVSPEGPFEAAPIAPERRSRSLPSRAVRRVARFFRRPAPALGPVEADIAPGDVFFYAAMGWHEPPTKDALPRLRARGARVITLICDITPLRCSHLLVPQLKEHFQSWLPQALGVSDKVLTISEFSRADLLAYCRQRGLSAPLVETMRLGDEPGPEVAEARPASGPDRDFVLCVGTISLHKNQWMLLHLWRRMLREHGPTFPALVLVGAVGWRQGELLDQLQGDEELAGNVFVLSEAGDSELRWLYRHCLFTVYPSYYEGWGLPVAESLAYGKYCISSSAASLPEVGGDLVDYHDPYDASECRRLIERAVFDPGLLREREDRIRREHHVTTWEECARKALGPLLGARRQAV